MDVNDLISLIRHGESDTLDFKRELPKNGTDIAQLASSFSNTRGGIVLVGVEDDGNLIGIDQPDKVLQRLVSLTQGACNPPLVDVAFGSVPIGRDRFVAWMKIPRRQSGVCYVEEKCYIRVGPTSQAIRSPNQLEATLRGRTSPIPTGKPTPFPASKYVLGRDLVRDQIYDVLQTPHVSIVAILGISGIGKTTLAAYLAERLRDDGYAVGWVECRSETTVDTLKMAIASAVLKAGDQEASSHILSVEGGPVAQIEQIIDLSSAHKIIIVLNDYREENAQGICDFVRLIELYCKGPQFVMTSRVRPQSLGIYNTSAVHEIYLRDGLDQASCNEYLRGCNVKIDPEQSAAVWRITGEGHPKAVQLFASRARRVTPTILLATLPIFREAVRTEWLTPILEELPQRTRIFLEYLSAFEKAVKLEMLSGVSSEDDVLSMIMSLIDHFVCDLGDGNEVSIHPLLREYLRGGSDTSSKDLWAANVWIGDIDLFSRGSRLDDVQIDRLVSAWSHAAKHLKGEELANHLALRLCKPLMETNQLSQLKLLLDTTHPVSIENEHIFALHKSKIASKWGENTQALQILSDLLIDKDSSIRLECILEYAKALLGVKKAREAATFLRRHRQEFTSLRGSRLSARFLNRLIEAMLESGENRDALTYAQETLIAANDRQDNL